MTTPTIIDVSGEMGDGLFSRKTSGTLLLLGLWTSTVRCDRVDRHITSGHSGVRPGKSDHFATKKEAIDNRQ